VNGVPGAWSSSPSFLVSGLNVYSSNYFRVRSRDINQNTTAWSGYAGATTYAQTIYNASGIWVCPAGVSNVLVEAWGGGAGGGNVSATARQSGGPSGAYARDNVAVVPARGYTVTVGVGGPGGNPGGTSWFNDTTTVLAVGGVNESLGVPGVPGQADACVGAVRYSGADYGNRSDTAGDTGGGGGGGSPTWFGSGTAGADGTATAGGAGGTGEGAGGDGGGPNTAGADGQTPGGGGGGHGGSASALTSGSGGSGQIAISWAVPGAATPVSNQPPVVVVGASPTSGSTPLTVAFSSAGTLDPEGGVLIYTWSFGDGTSSTAANPSKTYLSAGVFTARLNVSDGVNSVSSSDIAITVTGATINQPPIAVVSATPSSGTAPLQVAFSSAGSSDPEGGSLTYSWDFGDGTSSTAANPTHTYQSAGTYAASLRLSDGDKTTLSESMPIVVTTTTANTIPGSTFVDFETSSDGTPMTALIAEDSTKGQLYQWHTSNDSGSYSPGSTPNLQIETSAQHDLYTPAAIGGTTYPGVGTRGMRAIQSSDNFLVLTFPSAMPKLSVGFYFRWNGPAINWAPRDVFAMTDNAGRYQFLQIYDNASGSTTPYFHTHWQPGGSGIGNDVNFKRNNWYWVTMVYATGGNTFRIRFYDAEAGYSLTGESTASIGSGPVGPTKIVMGQVKYASGGSQSLDFDNLIINTNGVFPLGPGSGGSLPSDLPPVVAAAATPQTGVSPLTVSFSSAGTTDPEGGTLTYNWWFGDGTTSTAANPTKTYSSPGVYTARLTVSDGVNSVASADMEITVTQPATPLSPPQNLRVVGL